MQGEPPGANNTKYNIMVEYSRLRNHVRLPVVFMWWEKLFSVVVMV